MLGENFTVKYIRGDILGYLMFQLVHQTAMMKMMKVELNLGVAGVLSMEFLMKSLQFSPGELIEWNIPLVPLSPRLTQSSSSLKQWRRLNQNVERQ